MATYTDRALTDGHATLDTSGPKTRITYVAVGRSEIYDDPEEKVRAEFWAELIYRYGYKPERIGVEITVPDRTPKDAADLVVFEDDERTRPFAVIERTEWRGLGRVRRTRLATSDSRVSRTRPPCVWKPPSPGARENRSA